jgi:hypothetical protein
MKALVRLAGSGFPWSVVQQILQALAELAFVNPHRGLHFEPILKNILENSNN